MSTFRHLCIVTSSWGVRACAGSARDPWPINASKTPYLSHQHSVAAQIMTTHNVRKFVSPFLIGFTFNPDTGDLVIPDFAQNDWVRFPPLPLPSLLASYAIAPPLLLSVRPFVRLRLPPPLLPVMHADHQPLNLRRRPARSPYFLSLQPPSLWPTAHCPVAQLCLHVRHAPLALPW